MNRILLVKSIKRPSTKILRVDIDKSYRQLKFIVDILKRILNRFKVFRSDFNKKQIGFSPWNIPHKKAVSTTSGLW